MKRPACHIRSVALSTLSPVHIGCGDDYEPTHFVIHGGLLHVLDPADLALALSDEERRKLAALADEREAIGALQRYFRSNAERFARLARRSIAAAEAVCRDYEEKAGRPTQRSSDGSATYNCFPIARTAFRPLDGGPYLPGSALKGSMRTAWLSQRNQGEGLRADEEQAKNPARLLEQRLLAYREGRFQDDPFRQLAVADAQPDDDASVPPTQVLYAISKKKRPPRTGERSAPDLRVFLETVPAALPAAFHGEIRLTGDWRWNDLCDACNAFYRPQLRAELQHGVLGALLDGDWRRLMTGLLDEEIEQLSAVRQGCLLRVGRHSGAESLTIEGVRRIKILGPFENGRRTYDWRATTSEKRFASERKRGDGQLLPFGWIWVDACCDDRHRHLVDSLQDKLAAYSRALRDQHADRLARREETLRQIAAAAAASALEAQRAQATAVAAAAAEEDRQRARAAMTANRRRVEEFADDFARRSAQLRGQKENANGVYHGKARALARAAADWPLADERAAAADAIESWLPKVVRLELKEERKKLGLAALRST